MTARARQLLFLAGTAVAAPLLAAALIDLARTADFARLIGAYYLDAGVADRRSYNVVSSVIYDYRGFDTMGEQLILFAAAVGVGLLLRVQRGEVERSARESIAGREVPSPSSALKLAGVVVMGFTFLIGVYIILSVHVTPGGGFQSGVLLASGLLAAYIASEYGVYARLAPEAVLERVESVAAGLYVAVGFAGLLVAGSFLANFVPLGSMGGLYGGGTIWVLNLIVGFEVTAGCILIFTEFLEQAVLIRERARR